MLTSSDHIAVGLHASVPKARFEPVGSGYGRRARAGRSLCRRWPPADRRLSRRQATERSSVLQCTSAGEIAPLLGRASSGAGSGHRVARVLRPLRGAAVGIKRVRPVDDDLRTALRERKRDDGVAFGRGEAPGELGWMPCGHRRRQAHRRFGRNAVVTLAEDEYCRAYGSGGTSIDEKGRPYTKIDCNTKQPIG